MIKLKNNNVLGNMSGITSGICWGLDTALIGIALGLSPFNKPELIFLAPFLPSFFHDGFSAIWMLIITIIKGDFNTLKKAFKSKDFKVVAIAAILGGPVGMTGYLLAVKYIGPAYAASISAVYPAVGAIISRIFLGERLSKKAYFGLFISITALIILGFDNTNLQDENFVLGFMFALVGVLGWALEGVICSYGMKGEDINPNSALQIRQVISSLTYLIIVLPLVGGLGYLKTTLFSYAGFMILGIALVGTLSYIFYYKAIDTIGPTKAMGMNITYCIWAMIFGYVLGVNTLTLKLVICGIMVLIGTVLSANHE